MDGCSSSFIPAQGWSRIGNLENLPKETSWSFWNTKMRRPGFKILDVWKDNSLVFTNIVRYVSSLAFLPNISDDSKPAWHMGSPRTNTTIAERTVNRAEWRQKTRTTGSEWRGDMSVLLQAVRRIVDVSSRSLWWDKVLRATTSGPHHGSYKRRRTISRRSNHHCLSPGNCITT